MLKVKIKDKFEYIKTTIKGNANLLESIILLDMAINNLKDEYNLSDEQISSYLAQYREHLKEKEVK